MIGPTGGAELAGGEDARARRLLDAQAKAAELFQALEDRGLIAPGVRESAASDAIRDLAARPADRRLLRGTSRPRPHTWRPDALA